MAARTWLDAELGRQFDDEEELEILGGQNWVGFTITRDDVNNVYTYQLDPDAVPAPGTAGQLMYNAAGVLAGVPGTTFTTGLLDLSSVAISFDGAACSVGRIRVGKNAQFVIVGMTDADAEASIIYWDNDNLIHGDATNTAAQAFNVKSGGFGQFFVGASYIFGWDVNRLHLNNHNIDDVSSINGTRVVVPTQGSTLNDADQTITPDQGAHRQIPTLTANRTYDIDNTNAIDEEFVYLYRTGTEAFTATIRDHANATIATFPVSTRLMGAFQKTVGGNFVFRGFTRISALA